MPVPQVRPVPVAEAVGHAFAVGDADRCDQSVNLILNAESALKRCQFHKTIKIIPDLCNARQ
ncbi:MAG: hypothetical protein F6K52_19075 [Moorea sp. SIO3H5]|nr:hypothetical protein [Moorena sp. SIO3H5]